MKTDTKFRQKQRVGVAGSFINQMRGNNATLPEVGKGATEMHYTDRTCYEVIEVSDDHQTVKLEVLDAKADLTKTGGEGHQNWILEPTGRFITVVWRRDAWRTRQEVVTFTKAFRDKVEAEQSEKMFPDWRKALGDEQFKEIYGDNIRPVKVVDGITKKKFEYSKISIIFGSKDYYYDWSF